MWIALTGQTFSHLPHPRQSFPARAMKLEWMVRAMANRLIASSASQQHPQQLQLKFTPASHIIKTASHIGVSMCYCRHKMQHLGRACDAPMDICMTFNTSARSLIKYGHAP